MNNSYILRYMRPEDIQQVLEIDKLSFPMPWSARSYTFEISENKASHMIIVETAPQLSTAKGLRGVFQRLSGHTTEPTIAGYGGFWLIEGEAHEGLSFREEAGQMA